VTCLVCSEELEQQGRQALCVWLAIHSTIVQGESRWHGGNIGRCRVSSPNTLTMARLLSALPQTGHHANPVPSGTTVALARCGTQHLMMKPLTSWMEWTRWLACSTAKQHTGQFQAQRGTSSACPRCTELPAALYGRDGVLQLNVGCTYLISLMGSFAWLHHPRADGLLLIRLLAGQTAFSTSEPSDMPTTTVPMTKQVYR
jgi:hypothetical protein